MPAPPATDPLRFAYWVPNVSGGLVTSSIEQRWDYDDNRELAVRAEDNGPLPLVREMEAARPAGDAPALTRTAH